MSFYSSSDASHPSADVDGSLQCGENGGILAVGLFVGGVELLLPEAGVNREAHDLDGGGVEESFRGACEPESASDWLVLSGSVCVTSA